MKQLLLVILIIAPIFLSCSKDDKDEIDAGEKTQVVAEDIIGAWEYEDAKFQRTHVLSFEPDGVSGLHLQYMDNKLADFNNFTYTISGLTITVRGTTSLNNYKTEIFKRGEKLYFLDMPFTPRIKNP
jgi:hypothetical protein